MNKFIKKAELEARKKGEKYTYGEAYAFIDGAAWAREQTLEDAAAIAEKHGDVSCNPEGEIFMVGKGVDIAKEIREMK